MDEDGEKGLESRGCVVDINVVAETEAGIPGTQLLNVNIQVLVLESLEESPGVAPDLCLYLLVILVPNHEVITISRVPRAPSVKSNP